MEFDARPGNRHKLKSSYWRDIYTRNYIQSRKDNEVNKYQNKTTAPNISVVTDKRWQEKSFSEKKCFMSWINLLLHIIAQRESFSQIDCKPIVRPNDWDQQYSSHKSNRSVDWCKIRPRSPGNVGTGGQWDLLQDMEGDNAPRWWPRATTRW